MNALKVSFYFILGPFFDNYYEFGLRALLKGLTVAAWRWWGLNQQFRTLTALTVWAPTASCIIELSAQFITNSAFSEGAFTIYKLVKNRALNAF